jgi:hypothetical protein
MAHKFFHVFVYDWWHFYDISVQDAVFAEEIKLYFKIIEEFDMASFELDKAQRISFVSFDNDFIGRTYPNAKCINEVTTDCNLFILLGFIWGFENTDVIGAYKVNFEGGIIGDIKLLAIFVFFIVSSAI